MRGSAITIAGPMPPVAFFGSTPHNARPAYNPATRRLAALEMIAESLMPSF
jgi:hypothetical protein